MSRPRRRMFGPLFYSTLVVALLVAAYDVVLNAPNWLEGASKALSERREVAALAEAVRSPDPSARENAAGRLLARGRGVYGPIFLDATRDPRGDVRAQAYHYLAEGWGEPSELLPVLLAASGDGDEHVRLEGAIGLGRLALYRPMAAGGRSPAGTSGGPTPIQRDEAVRALRRLLRDSSGPVRAAAAGSMALFGPDPATAADLAAATEDDDRAVRFAAARALVKVGGPDDPAAARELVAIAASSDADPDRLEAIRVIGTMSEAAQDRAVAALVKLLSRGEPDIIPDVIACLPEVGPRAKAAVPALEALLDHAEPGLRGGAAMAVVAIESPDDFRALRPAAPGGMGGGMAGLIAGGGGLGTGAGTAIPAAGRLVAPRVVAILARVVGDAAIPMESRMIALGMIQAAGPSALSKATPALVGQLADADPNVRRTAIELLSQVIDAAPAGIPSAAEAR